MAVTGMVNNDDPTHDLPLGESIPGPLSNELSKIAVERDLWIGIGVLERDGRRLYDTAILISPQGQIKMKYRRCQPHWHGKHADSSVYCQGTQIFKAETDFGSVVFLICGNLWDEGIRMRVKDCIPIGSYTCLQGLFLMDHVIRNDGKVRRNFLNIKSW